MGINAEVLLMTAFANLGTCSFVSAFVLTSVVSDCVECFREATLLGSMSAVPFALNFLYRLALYAFRKVAITD